MPELTENFTVHGPMEVHPLGAGLFAVVFAGSRNTPDATPEPLVWRVSGADLADLAVKIEKARLLGRALDEAPSAKASH